LNFTTVGIPHEATYRELMALHQTLRTMALLFLCGTRAQTLAYSPFPLLRCLYHTIRHKHTQIQSSELVISLSQSPLHSAERTQHKSPQWGPNPQCR